MAWRRAIGLMSGTSLDGIDVALIETDGRVVRVVRGRNGFVEPLGPTAGAAYGKEERALLRQALLDAERLTDRASRPGSLAAAENLVTRRHAEAVEALLAREGLRPSDIAVIGFHGQTVVHRPDQGLTVQIGDGPALARRLGIPVVHDLRAADVAAGGQGAPLVPVFHRALAESSGFELPLAVLNIGGVANVTLIGRDGTLLGFDTGPGNALVDDLMHERGGAEFDAGGATAARGQVDAPLLAWLLEHPYFRQAPPKSLDRNWFSHRLVGRLPLEDAAATLTAFTTEAVACALAWAETPPRRWIVGGGGAKNRHMLARLREKLGVEVTTADEVGWSSEFLEAQAFAYLAVRSLEGLPITFPGTTGVAAPLTGGVLAEP
jgi:anhydro-N-acetylmuramic acid kinase